MIWSSYNLEGSNRFLVSTTMGFFINLEKISGCIEKNSLWAVNTNIASEFLITSSELFSVLIVKIFDDIK